MQFHDVERRFGIRFDEHFGRELEKLALLAADGLVRLHEYGFTVTPRGRLLLRVVAMVFDTSLDGDTTPISSAAKEKGARPQFSRVI